MEKSVDVMVAGGGIVGLAAAWQILRRFPGLNLLLLEKEAEVARHQSGHNSGVIHSGIYYRPGSYKARLCRRGYTEMIAFCREYRIPFEVCGKLVIAVAREELPRLEALREKAAANGLPGVKELSGEGIREFEPHAVGEKALLVPETGIVDYRAVAMALKARIVEMGGDVATNRKVTAIADAKGEKRIGTGDGERATRFFINCGGLHSDRLAQLDGLDPGASIIPFRGEYYALKPPAQGLVRNLIYPVPDPEFPFLGVHFTRMIHGGVECGPNAVPALRREGYRKRDFSAGDLLETLADPGFRKLAMRHWRMGLHEFHRSFSKRAFGDALRRLVPEVEDGMLEAGGSGVRAQAVGRDGSLIDDFRFAEGMRSLHVLNAPSPAATASLAIGEEIAARYASMRG